MDATTRRVEGKLPRSAELLAGLSVAIDLGLGQPAEHMLRSAIITCRLADRLGLDEGRRGTAYYTSLLLWIGCTADSQEYARWFGDDIAVRRESVLVDWSGMPFMRFLVGNIARGEPLPRRLKTMGSLFRDSRGQLGTLLRSHCTSASVLAHHLGLPPEVEHSLAYAFERYDGGGLPNGVSGADIPIEIKIVQLADIIEVHHRLRGVVGAVAVARERRGGQFDPRVVDALLDAPEEILEAAGRDSWDAAIAEAPDAATPLDQVSLDHLVQAIGDFTDLKCPFGLGHSRGVAELAANAAEGLGLDHAEVGVVRRAGHLHDVGRLGVSSQIWSKPGELTPADWEYVRMHPYLTDRVLTRIPGLTRERELARAHHEHVDGSGYPSGLSGMALGQGERILAAAVAYQSALEPRPYRQALTPEDAAARLRRRAERGELDADCVAAILSTAGHRATKIRRDDTLTSREREVLGYVARGLSNREIAQQLVLSEKTVRNHIEHTYSKIGVSNRVGASLYALEHGVTGPRHSAA